MLFDTHAHLNMRAFREDADEVIKNCLSNDCWLVNVGAEYNTSKRAVMYAEKYSQGVYAAIGIHPTQLKEARVVYESDDDRMEYETTGEVFDPEKYLELARHPKVVAIGEIGFDYHHFEEGDDVEYLKRQQQEVFVGQIGVANQAGKPVMIHCWDAFQDLLSTLKEYPVDKKGIIHSFSGSYKVAKELRDMGYKLGFNGVVTYSISYDRVIRETPLEDMVLETDCPYLTPLPLSKTQRNIPLNVKYVAERIANIKNVSVEEVTEKTSQTARSILNI